MQRRRCAPKIPLLDWARFAKSKATEALFTFPEN
jgi:hypothetical protein